MMRMKNKKTRVYPGAIGILILFEEWYMYDPACSEAVLILSFKSVIKKLALCNIDQPKGFKICIIIVLICQWRS